MGMALSWRGPALLLALLVGLGACSVTDYQKPIDQFASASKDAETALSALNTEVTNAYADLLRERAVSGQGLVEVADGDCVADSTQCRLVLFNRDGSTEPLTPAPAAQHMVALMGSITTYADNLVALVSADTAAAVAANVNATLGSIESLAATVEGAGGAKPTVDLAAYTTPVGNAVAWIVGQYVASVKVEGLRRATSEAQPVIAEATEVFEAAARAASLVPRATMGEDVDRNLAAFDANRSQQRLRALIQSADRFNELLEAKPTDVFAAMSAAHGALTDQLQGKNVTLAQAFARIEAFAAEAKHLAQIAKSLAAAAQTEG